MPARDPAPPWLPLVLAAALAAVSAAAVLVRGLPDLDAVGIAWWRVLGSGLLLLPFLGRIERRDVLPVLASGACLGAHFATWFLSLRETTVLHSTVLVCLSPLWVGLVEWFRGEVRPTPAFFGGIGLAVVGAGAMASAPEDTATLRGDLVALVGGWLSAAYLLLGRRVRSRLGTGRYGAATCLGAALCLTPWVAWSEGPLLPTTGLEAALLLGCMLGPQLVGHNGLNYALRFLPAARVSSLLLLEPVGAALLAGWFLGEWPGPAGATGAGLLVVGVVLAVRGAREGSTTEAAAA